MTESGQNQDDTGRAFLELRKRSVVRVCVCVFTGLSLLLCLLTPPSARIPASADTLQRVPWYVGLCTGSCWQGCLSPTVAC